MLRSFARARYGGRVQWHGPDVFHFDADGHVPLPLREADDGVRK